jgi:hypothetical protein
MTRLYCADILKCEDFLYEDLDTLIEYAKQNPSEFVIYTDIEDVEVKHGDDGLEITYKMIDEYDENDEPVWKYRTESFDIEYQQMMVTVPEVHQFFKSA